MVELQSISVVNPQAETFTSPLNAAAQTRISFGGRDGGSDTTATGSSWTLTNTATGVTVASATGFKPATGSWLLNSTTTPALTSGASYRFQINLDDTAMVDAASISIVPEPSTFTALGGLMLLGGGCVVLRRARFA